MKSQITVWFLAATLFSIVLPNAVVVAVFTPTALAMLKAAGYRGSDPAAGPILCAIVFGSVVGGVGTPVGGAMDVIAAALYQQATGEEFLFTRWFGAFLPYLGTATAATLGVQLLQKDPVSRLQGTREYFLAECRRLGAMSRDEKSAWDCSAWPWQGPFSGLCMPLCCPGSSRPICTGAWGSCCSLSMERTESPCSPGTMPSST